MEKADLLWIIGGFVVRDLYSRAMALIEKSQDKKEKVTDDATQHIINLRVDIAVLKEKIEYMSKQLSFLIGKRAGEPGHDNKSAQN